MTYVFANNCVNNTCIYIYSYFKTISAYKPTYIVQNLGYIFLDENSVIYL